MAKLEIFLLFVLLVEGISGAEPDFYHAVGDDVVLPCVGASSSCLSVRWLYNDIVGSLTKLKVTDGNINQESVKAARLSLDTDCSLIIKNIIPKDAGRYACRRGSNPDSLAHLNILSISPSPPAGDATKDGNINLQCSLWRYLQTRCSDKRFVWVNDRGTELVGEDVTGQKSSSQIQCVSSLTVKPLNNRYTCQLFEGNRMKIETHYTPLSTDQTQMDPIYIIGPVLAVGLLLLLAAITAVLINCRRKTKQSDEPKNSNSDVIKANNQIHQDMESPPALTYASIGHFSPNSPLRVTVQQDAVTYSAVKPKMETDFDLNSLYSHIRKPE